jgi:hypothetical protein
VRSADSRSLLSSSRYSVFSASHISRETTSRTRRALSRAWSTHAVTEAGLSRSSVRVPSASAACTGPGSESAGTPSAAMTSSQESCESGPPAACRLARKSPSSMLAVSSARAT